jgi:CRISPR-associated protein Cas5t
MEAVRCDITAYTASFRLPGMMGYQVTAEVPPPSTILGLLSAACGKDLTPDDVEWFAYRFTSSARSVDLEKIIAYGEKGPFFDPKLGAINTVPIKREFLYDPKLVLYVPPKFEDALKRPRFQICLGRSQDVASVDLLKPTELQKVDEYEVEGVLIPFPAQGRAPGSAILNLPTFMQQTIPRTPHAVRIFHIVTKRQRVKFEELYLEPGEELAVPMMTKELLLSGGAE